MKKNIFLLSIYLVLASNGMEPEHALTKPEIPVELSFKYSHEKKKFEKYDLDHPEKFLQKLQTQFKKAENSSCYLEMLQIFASKLLIQHLLTQHTWNVLYWTDYHNELIETIEQLMNKMGATLESEKFFLTFHADEELSEILAHSNLLQEKIYTPDQLKTIFTWIIDPKYGQNLGMLGLSRIKIHEKLLTREQLDIQEKNFKAFANPIVEEEFQESVKDPKIIKENTDFLTRLYSNLEQHAIKVQSLFKYKKAAVFPLAIIKEFSKENKNITNLYVLVQDWYKKLYRIIRKEIDDTIRQLITSHKPKGDIEFLKKLQQYTLTLPESLRKAQQVPEKLPNQLPDLIDPKKVMPLPSLAQELEQFRIEWEKTHPKEEEKKEEIKPKKIRIKKPKAQKVEPLKPCPLPTQIIEQPEEPKETEEIEQEFFENEKNITISNRENQTVETIFKTDKPFQIHQALPPIHYTRWVNMWFENPQYALCIQGYTDPRSKKFTAENLYWRPIVLHSFSPLIDTLIQKWGTVTTSPNRKQQNRLDYLVTLPGKMTYPDGSSETGVFAYLIDSSNGQWYHRMFEPQKGQKLIADLFEKGYFSPSMQGYYEVFFPPLGVPNK